MSYWTAYLKANYPAEYMAALLTSVKDDKDKMAIYLNECRRMKIQVLPPDVNESEANFTPVGTDIRFGLTAIRNVGCNVVDGDRRRRAREKGRFADFADFMDKVPALVCNKRVIESLVKAGAFDEMKHRRRALVADPRDRRRPVRRHQAQRGDRPGLALRRARRRRRRRLRASSVAVPDIDEWDKMTLLGHEREMLGLYVSDHPLLGLEHVLVQRRRLHHRPAAARRGARRRLARSPSAAWSPRCSARSPSAATPGRSSPLEDLEGAIDVLLFPSAYQLASTYLVEDAIVTVKGRLVREQGPARAARPGGHRPGPRATGRPGPVRDHAAVDAVHAAGGGAAQGRAAHPPGHDRGAAAAADPRRDHGAAARRPAAGHARRPALFADLKQLLGPDA